ncbi:methyltransferase, partial [Cellulomonas bogoriensis 69B4 = DSM 16987]
RDGGPRRSAGPGGAGGRRPAAPRTGSQAPSQRRRTGDPARTVALDLLLEVEEQDAYANLVMPTLLRRDRLSGRDAAFATELAYGTLRLQGRYDPVIAHAAGRPVDGLDAPVRALLRLGAHQLLAMRVPPHAAVSETVALARARVGVGASQLVNAVLRRVTERTPEEWREATRVEDPVADLAVHHSHPGWVVRALTQALVADGRDGDVAALLEADNAAPAVTVAARPGLADRDELAAQVDGVPGRWAPTAVTLPGGAPGDVPGMRSGAVGVQDEGSQLVTLALLEVPVDGPDERWL